MNARIGKALVVGAGIAGIRAALDLAEYGYSVVLVERAPRPSGLLGQLDRQFPTDRCGMCRLLPRVERDAASADCLRRGLFHERIDLRLNTEVAGIEGEAGRLRVRLRRPSGGVDPERCAGCGRCAAVCPVEVPDEFNAGLTMRKAVDLPAPQCFPHAYALDPSACTRCGACREVCPTGAIRLPGAERRSFRILLVDDEWSVRDSLKEWLEAEGFSTAMAASGPEALAALREKAFQLMLLDIKMPGMDGVEVLERAKQISPGLDVVMMTAYATVETAVEAMKIGALDYLIKPFDVADLIPKAVERFERFAAAEDPPLTVGAVVLCGGSEGYDPLSGKNPYGYGVFPGVLTQVEFERLTSATGPTGGRLLRPDGRGAVRRIAWIQCVGSRDAGEEADFCSSVCCMASIKEALLAKALGGGDLEATIFHMDLRTAGKSFQRYRDQAEERHGVRFIRARPHSLTPAPGGEGLRIRWVEAGGESREENFDLVVLATGRRPAAGMTALAERLGLPLNPWGFIAAVPFSRCRTARPGVVIGGTCGGMVDIAETVIQASAAAAEASRCLQAAGGGQGAEERPAELSDSVLRELPRVAAVMCRCRWSSPPAETPEPVLFALGRDPEVATVETADALCTPEGRRTLAAIRARAGANRLLIGACRLLQQPARLRDIARDGGLTAGQVETADLALCSARTPPDAQAALFALRSGLARLKRSEPPAARPIPVAPAALVLGGGVAGMTAALVIADHGAPVELVETSERLGGNLTWLTRTIEGADPRALRDDLVRRVEGHPRIRVHKGARIVHAEGEVGSFVSFIEGPDGEVRRLEHGVVLFATGGREAPALGFGYGESPAVATQAEVERRLSDGTLPVGALDTVVTIQCAGSRREPRNYCSRICCPASLRLIEAFRERRPELRAVVLYRDLMTTGFAEAAYTRARGSGVLFIPYPSDRPPAVRPTGAGAVVAVEEPILGRPLEIEAQLVVLATGIVPALSRELVEAFGGRLDEDGFFQPADAKWRPVDGMAEGVFACGLALSPRTIPEAIATAEAAAMRALGLLGRERLFASRIVARVRHSLCSRCEQCIAACPCGARRLDEELGRVIVHPVRCQGCGTCAAVCPNDAAILEGFPPPQMFSILEAALG
ncbi:MAG: response regulator [Desulfobacterales bacterium]